MSDFMSLGRRIRHYRMLRGMTQKALGIAAGFPPETADIFLCQVGTKKIFENLQAVHRRTTTRERLACELNS